MLISNGQPLRQGGFRLPLNHPQPFGLRSDRPPSLMLSREWRAPCLNARPARPNPIGTSTYLILCVRSSQCSFHPAFYLGRIKLRYAKSLSAVAGKLWRTRSGRATPHQSSRPGVLFLSCRGGRCRRALPVFVPWNYALARAGNSAGALMSVGFPLDRLGASPPSPERTGFPCYASMMFPLKSVLVRLVVSGQNRSGRLLPPFHCPPEPVRSFPEELPEHSANDMEAVFDARTLCRIELQVDKPPLYDGPLLDCFMNGRGNNFSLFPLYFYVYDERFYK